MGAGDWGRVSLAALACAMSAGAHAQERTASSADEGVVEAVIVTAQRRDENLQTVPVAVTAVTAAQMDRLRITDVTALTRVTPSLSINPGYKANDIRIGIRGLVDNLGLITTDAAVGIYIDGVYYAANPGANQAMIDMERAEVLKGPQGTLFGRNTIGGALNITTRKPADGFEGSFQAEYGNYDLLNVTGIVNLPLGAGWGGRVAFQHAEHDGFGRNTFLDSPLGDLKQDYVRAALGGPLSEAWDLQLSGFYTKSEGHPTTTKVLYVNPASPLNAALPALNGRPGDLLSNYVGGDFYDNRGDINPRLALEVYGGAGTVTGRLGDVTVKSITGLVRVESQAGTDVDGTPYPGFNLLGLPLKRRTFSEELQAYGEALDGRLEWIVGAYYFTDKGSQYSFAQAVAPIAGSIASAGAAIDNTSKAVFGQASFRIAPQWRVTAGVRYTEDRRAVTYRDHAEAYVTRAFLRCSLANAPNNPNPAACVYANDAKFDYTPWTLGLDFTPTDTTLVYAKVSKGYRSGAYPFSGPAAAATPAATANNLAVFQAVAPESVLSPEVGVKLDLLDRRLRLNAAGYYAKYSNIQQTVPVFVNGAIVPALRNAGDGRIWGGEVEATALIGRLQVSGSLGITSPKYTSGPAVGQPFQLLSKTTWSLNVYYPIETSAGELTLSAAYNWQSKKYFANLVPGNAQLNADVTQKGYGLLSARASLKLADGPITLSVWGQNLTDEEYKIQANTYQSNFGFDAYWAGTPRQYGVSVAYAF